MSLLLASSRSFTKLADVCQKQPRADNRFSGMSLKKMVSVCVLILLWSEAVPVGSSPTKYSKWSDYQEAHGKQVDLAESKCKNGGAIRDLCERCSKITKNEVVFPLCCENKEKVRSWCKDFLNYQLPTSR